MNTIFDINGNVLNLTSESALCLKGHSWSVLGDSISTPNLNNVSKKYWAWINERSEGMDIHNYGISGTRITNFSQRYNQMYYSDIITVFGGVNDWGQPDPTPLGTITDTTNDTFYGALDILCKGLLTNYPKSTVIFFTPLGNKGFSPNYFYEETNSLGLTIYDYADAILNVCGKYKIPVVDTCRNSLLNPYIPEIKVECFVDGLHLNEHGHEILSFIIESEMLKHYIPTIVDELPTGYEKLSYITANGNQSLRLNYTPVQNDEFHIRYKGQNGTLMSAGTGTYQLVLVSYTSNQGWYFRYFSSTALNVSNLSSDTWYDLNIDETGTLTIGGASIAGTYGAELDGTATDLWIAERRNESTLYTGSIAEFWIKNNGQYKVYLIPCKRNSDDKVGMYDTISHTFFTSSRSDFIAGT